MTIITLTTDFGLHDGFVGVLKGVIWSISPEARIADISHTVTPQNILEAAYVLWRAYSFFPAGTVHLAVVDPGVGTERRPVAVRLGAHTFVGPDNGLFTPMYLDAEKSGAAVEFIHLTDSRYWLPVVSNTFHGRDIFAPAAAHLANGVPLADLGQPLADPVRLAMPMPEKIATGWRAHITIADVFGNLTTDLPAKAILHKGDIIFRLRGHEIHGLVDSYGHRQTGDLVALVDSEDFIEIAVVNGNAARLLEAKVGDIVEVILPS